MYKQTHGIYIHVLVWTLPGDTVVRISVFSVRLIQDIFLNGWLGINDEQSMNRARPEGTAAWVCFTHRPRVTWLCHPAETEAHIIWAWWSSDSFSTSRGDFYLKEKFGFLHIKPYKKNSYDHIRCFTALLWQPVQSWELELVADITVSRKQQKSMCTQTICQKSPKTLVLKDMKLAECLVFPLLYWQ